MEPRIANPKYLRKSLDRLKVLQQRASKKQKGSNNRKKANLKVAKLYERITNQRKDFLQKLSTKIISENQTVILETLNVAGMIRNHCLAQAISDVSWSEFVRQLEYKAEWQGKNIIRIGRFEASSKTCSCCGSINKTSRCPIVSGLVRNATHITIEMSTQQRTSRSSGSSDHQRDTI